MWRESNSEKQRVRVSRRHPVARSCSRSVHPHVSVEVPRLTESEQTQFALVRFFAAVDPQVFRQRAAVREGFLAQPASVGSLSGVGAHVGRDGGTLGEPPVADGTPERLFSGVGAHVGRQVGRLRERLVAVDASVRFLARVCAEMRFQGAGTRVTLS